mmetsp:Transcript_39564/g.93166  ORF Transcript_39564/g.93166 Transcript_39564/m.93166 type:complete len:99 (-) Transcript_39564:899-1195(-)
MAAPSLASTTLGPLHRGSWRCEPPKLANEKTLIDFDVNDCLIQTCVRSEWTVSARAMECAPTSTAVRPHACATLIAGVAVVQLSPAGQPDLLLSSSVS